MSAQTPPDGKHRLTVQNHDRDVAGMTYVYPVVSRRAGGVSIGINLNPNNACNWACVYCQVPELTRGVAPPIDVARLRQELRVLLHDVVEGDYLIEHVPDPAHRHLVDVAFSGNGEPTTCKRFDAIVDAVLEEVGSFGLLTRADPLNLVVISNGSMLGREEVQRGLTTLGKAGGEVWFKIDGGDEATRARINQIAMSNETVVRNLVRASGCLRTRIQTCVFTMDDQGPDDAWVAAYTDLLTQARGAGALIHDVLLYGLARPSLQPQAGRLAALSRDALESVAQRIRDAGFEVKANY